MKTKKKQKKKKKKGETVPHSNCPPAITLNLSSKEFLSAIIFKLLTEMNKNEKQKKIMA